MKAGTSSFGHDLNKHPEIFVYPNEIHYFSSIHYQITKNLKWYLEHFNETDGKVWIGEKTPTYSYHPEAAERIYKEFPKIKLIWLLRDPIDRAYSHYNFFLQRGQEYASFKQAINRELKGQTDHFTKNYLDRSIYVNQISAFQEYFSLDNMIFLKYEDYIHSPQQTINQVIDFFKLPMFHLPLNKSSKRNQTYLPRNRYLQYFLRYLFKEKLQKGSRIYKKLSQVNRLKTPGYPPLDPGTKGFLREYFAPFEKELQDLIGISSFKNN